MSVSRPGRDELRSKRDQNQHRRVWTRPTTSSNSSSEVGSIQCTSSYRAKTGCLAASPTSCSISAASVRSFGAAELRSAADSGSPSGSRADRQTARPLARRAVGLGKQSFELIELVLRRDRPARSCAARRVGRHRIKRGC